MSKLKHMNLTELKHEKNTVKRSISYHKMNIGGLETKLQWIETYIDRLENIGRGKICK